MTHLHATILGIMLLLVGSGCDRKSQEIARDIINDDHPEVRIGMQQSEVLRLLGQPSERRTYTKTDAPGFGFPAWWYREMQNGETAELWEYQGDEGVDQVYFLKGSTQVGHTRFVKKGIVF